MECNHLAVFPTAEPGGTGLYSTGLVELPLTGGRDSWKAQAVMKAPPEKSETQRALQKPIT